MGVKVQRDRIDLIRGRGRLEVEVIQGSRGKIRGEEKIAVSWVSEIGTNDISC